MEMTKYKLGDVADILVGFPFESEKFNTEGNGVRLVRGMNVSERFLRFGNDSRWWSDLTDGLTPYYLKEYDIVIGMDGSKVGKNFAIVKKEDLPLILVQRVACVRAKKGYDQKYIWQYISSPRFIEYVNTIKTGSSIPHISGKQIADFPIFLPTLSEQKKIAAVLSALDDYIENLRAQNRVLEQTAKTIYDYTFLQCAGHQTTYNKTLNRNIPADWEVKRLGDLVSVSKESLNPQNYPEKQFKHFSIPSFDDNGSYSLEYGKDIFSNKFIVNNNHVLISKLNPWKNRAVWCDENDDAIGSTEFVTLLPRKLENKAFVFSIVKSDSFIEYCSDAATGTSHSHRRVSPDIMMKFPIAYDEKTVIKFNAQVTPLFKKQLVNTKQIEALTTQRNTLLPLLMTGQVEVG